MKINLRLLFISVCFLVSLSCSNDDFTNPVIGHWELVTWSVDIPFELDNDMISSSNYLDKTACNVNETLTFDKNGTVTSRDTFNPEITISLKEDTSDIYIVEEICAEGSIGFSTSYAQVNNQNIELNGAVGLVETKKLTLVYPNAIKIYNEALTDVIENKNLTLVYLRK